MRSYAAWLSTATRCFGLLLVALLVVLCAPIRTAPAGPATNPVDTPLTLAMATALSAPDSASAAAANGAAARAIKALTAQLLDGRAATARPQTVDIAAIRAAALGVQDPFLRTAGIFGERRDAAQGASGGRSVTGAAVAFGAPDAGRGDGVSSPSLSGSSSSGSASAVLSGLSELAVHDGFTVARHTTRTGTIHASIQPLDRPG